MSSRNDRPTDGECRSDSSREATADRVARELTGEEDLHSSVEMVKENAQTIVEGAKTAITERIVPPEAQGEFALGKTATTHVTGPDGETVLRAGQTVTRDLIELAQRRGVLDAVYRATGGTLIEPLARSVGEMVGRVIKDDDASTTRGNGSVAQ